MRRILLVDNDPDFLATRAEFLERAGFDVFKAITLADAEKHLRDGWVHLAIFDIRMVDDDDEKDFSGMTLINIDFTHTITKIVLTSFNTPLVRDLVRIAQRTQPLMLDVIEKAEGPDALVTVVKEAFAQHVRINFSLILDWKAASSLDLVRRIEPGLEDERERLMNRADELEDLFRRLFYEKDHIRIERLLWQREGRAALVVFAFKEGAKPESFVVVCGQNAIVSEEARRFDEFAPKAPGLTGTMLGKEMRAETTHFAANAYTLAGNDLENAQTLTELYRVGPEKAFNASLRTLYQETLKAWHQDKLVREAHRSLEELYLERLNLENALDGQYLEERVKVIEAQIPRLKVNIKRADGKLTLHFSTGSFTYPDPIERIPQIIETEQPALLITVPGTLSGENILVDAGSHAWLTDFAEAGAAPWFWNFTSLEAAIRFDWVDTHDLLRRYELENSLIFTDFAKPDTRDLESIVAKPARAIAVIRKLSAREVGKDIQSYHLGIFLHAARRLADFDPGRPLMPNDLARLAHILLSMAMIAKKLEDYPADKAANGNGLSKSELRLDENAAHTVALGKKRIRIAPTPFSVLQYLYENRNKLCTKKDIIKYALNDKYDERYLHALISRIRREIEDDPDHPRYLITEPNAGYRLITNPE